MTEQLPMVITIDGPTASGKGTLASRLAEKLGWHYLDSGALFRLTAYAALEQGVELTDEDACAAVARSISPVFSGDKVTLDGKDVSREIRAEAVGLAASKVAVFPKVRAAILDLERAFRKAPGLVADGRDMGTVVFQDAALKVFLTASSEARANRRYTQLIQKGISANLQSLCRDLEERDKRDRERQSSPTRPADDAKLLDNSTMSIEETLDCVLDWYRQTRR